MSTAMTNGYDHAKAGFVTDGRDAHVHVHPPDSGSEVSQEDGTQEEPTYARAIARVAMRNQRSEVGNFVRLHAGEIVDSVTDGEVATYRPSTMAEAWKTCLADLAASRWYTKPFDFLAALLFMAMTLVVWLTTMALASPAGDTPTIRGLLRRRVALALVALATAAYVLARALRGQ